MRIAVSRRLWSLVVAALLSLCTSSAHADLVIDIATEVEGSSTRWTFSGSSTASAGGTIRVTDDLTPTPIVLDDSWEVGGNPVLDSVMNSLFDVSSGSATITVGGELRNITQVFLNGVNANGNDDFGVRVDSALAYSMNDASSWSGSIVLPIAVSDLRLGSYTLAGVTSPGPNFAAGGGALDINIVPEPASLAMLGVAGLFGGAIRFRRRKKGSADEQTAE